MKIKFAQMRAVMCLLLFIFSAGCTPQKTNETQDRERKENMSAKSEEPADIVVKDGESISDAVKKAKGGAVIEVEPGIYKETVTVDKHDITLRGKVDGDSRPVLEGENKLNDGLIASGNNFVMSGFKIQNYKGNGISTQGSNGVKLIDIFVDGTGVYGLYPVQSKNILIENCKATKIKDAAIYVGESHDIVVRNNEVYGNVAGIEIENSTNAVVENNDAHDNTGGILAFALPNKMVTVCENVAIKNNRVVNNNVKNFGDPKSIIGRLPSGSGIIIMAADAVVVRDNEIKNNSSFGVAMIELDLFEDPKKDPKLEPNPDRNQILNNVYEKNGTKPTGMVKEMLGKGADVIWSGAGEKNCAVKQKGVTTVGAENLPACKPMVEGEKKPETQSMNEGGAPGEKTETSANAEIKKKTDEVVVKIKGMTFVPMHVKIKAGQTVVWTNEDNVVHSIVSGAGTNADKKPALASPMMGPKAAYKHTFAKPGKYTYLCLPHAYQTPMRDATVTVVK